MKTYETSSEAQHAADDTRTAIIDAAQKAFPNIKIRRNSATTWFLHKSKKIGHLHAYSEWAGYRGRHHTPVVTVTTHGKRSVEKTYRSDTSTTIKSVISRLRGASNRVDDEERRDQERDAQLKMEREKAEADASKLRDELKWRGYDYKVKVDGFYRPHAHIVFDDEHTTLAYKDVLTISVRHTDYAPSVQIGFWDYLAMIKDQEGGAVMGRRGSE